MHPEKIFRNSVFITVISMFGMLFAGKVFKITILTAIGTYIGYVFTTIIMMLVVALLAYAIKEKFSERNR